MRQKALKKAMVSLLCAAAFTAAAWLGVFYSPDQMLSDSLYQAPRPWTATSSSSASTTGPWRTSAPTRPGAGM